MLIDPTSNTYDGTLVGINAVKDGTIAETGQDVVLKIASSGEADLHVMFNRKVGANNEVPQYGDQVVITEQDRERSTSRFWQASLSSREEYTQSNWGASGTFIVNVCSLETSSLVRRVYWCMQVGMSRSAVILRTTPIVQQPPQ